ncbi:PREDICTED: small glutamine-rich tetratricopeptide repeat-containing protein-like isoform X2 [Lupinus angustifolius]|uniref:small glutamine-rich tetratricopeptide repeat-containing protein-like isoform X2 n=1 Tax=Lupinus angustifolius TaxID=3871 RepID=UPI00092ED3C4|nr:PREDICTED: small glutamine-rich tetratricopeptide repeat-containing protein-like isoform X2 [Lupinus angustifolius]
MTHIATDSPLSRRIVRSFLHFLNSVEPGSGVDVEGIDVARECLAEAFKLNNHESDDHANPDSLIDLFKSLDANNQCETIKPDIAPPQQPHSVDAAAASSSSFSPQNPAQTQNRSEAPKSPDEDSIRRRNTFESKDELGVQFFAALEKIDYFRTNVDGIDDPLQLEKASCLLNDAFMDMEKSGCQEFSLKNLAESLKSLGNKAMQSKNYLDAIELYNCAIAVYEKSAVYYCNRAAAYTQIDRYTEAIQDCLKSIEIDPNYSKAYSRLGLAYYAQGNYRDAIDKGFDKALQLDPTNESVKENIRVAQLKLIEQFARQTQSSRPRSNAMPSSFTYTGDDIPEIFRNITSNSGHPRESEESISYVSRSFINMYGGGGGDDAPSRQP